MRAILVLCLLGFANAFPQGYQYPQPGVLANAFPAGYQYPQPAGSQTDAAILNRFVTDPDFKTMFLTPAEMMSQLSATQATDTQMAVLTIKQTEASDKGTPAPTEVATMSEKEEVKETTETSVTTEATKESDASGEEVSVAGRLGGDSKTGYKYPTPEDDVSSRFSELAANKNEVVSTTEKAVEETTASTSEAPEEDSKDMTTESSPTLDPTKLDEETEEVMKKLVLFPPSGEKTDFSLDTRSSSSSEFIPDVGKLPLSETTVPTMLAGNRTIVKHFYIHEAPEFDDEEDNVEELPTASPTTHYNIVFVKAPSDSAKTLARTLAKTQNEQKTIIYVLVKKTGKEEIHHALKLSPPPTNKPQVYFIRYKTPEEAENALNNIKNEYNLLGGENMYFNEGRAPVQSFIGKVNKPGGQKVSKPSGGSAFGGFNSFGLEPLGPSQQNSRPQGSNQQNFRPQGSQGFGGQGFGSRPQGSGVQGPRPQGSKPQAPYFYGPVGAASGSFNNRFSGQTFSNSRPSNSGNSFGLGPNSSGSRPSNRYIPPQPRKSSRYLPPPIPQFV